MTPSDYFKQHKQCLADGIAIKTNSDYYQCQKFGGICQALKCVNCHNNNVKHPDGK